MEEMKLISQTSDKNCGYIFIFSNENPELAEKCVVISENVYKNFVNFVIRDIKVWNKFSKLDISVICSTTLMQKYSINIR